MAEIFISYRRQDTIGDVGRIYDRLREHFGNDAVFIVRSQLKLPPTALSDRTRRCH